MRKEKVSSEGILKNIHAVYMLYKLNDVRSKHGHQGSNVLFIKKALGLDLDSKENDFELKKSHLKDLAINSISDIEALVVTFVDDNNEELVRTRYGVGSVSIKPEDKCLEAHAFTLKGNSIALNLTKRR